MKELLPYLALLVSVIACTISGWVALRAGKWRNSEEHARLLSRVGGLEAWKSLTDQKIEGIVHDLAQLPTKADTVRIEGEVNKICDLVNDHVVPGIRRIEGYMMGPAK